MSTIPKNLTSHAIQIVDQNTHKPIRVFPVFRHITFDTRHSPGHILDYDFPCRDYGELNVRYFSLEQNGLKPHDTVIMNYEDALVFKEIAEKNQITILIPGTHIGQCIRDRHEELVATFFLLRWFDARQSSLQETTPKSN